jgi:lipopolysaccharide/colanic/teichoic acid biosynthesis glycosyltransferase
MHIPENLTIYPVLRSKRSFDIVCAGALLFVFSPFIILTLFILKLEQILRGRPLDPLFYSEIRYSHGKPFRLYKFNIFKQDRIEELRREGSTVGTKVLERCGDVTYGGWVLKQIYMDEFPQFWNVLRGDMSIVGPRPLNMESLEKGLSQGNVCKLQVPAGITGHHQSRKNQVGRGMELDREYVVYYGNNPWYKVMLFDIYILIRTVVFVLRAEGI